MNADELAKILDELGRRLGPTGEYVFGLAVREVYIQAAVGMLLLVVTVAVGVIGGLLMRRWLDDGDSYSDRGFVASIFGVGYFVVALLMVVNAAMVIPDAFNPEYHALVNLMKALPR